MRADNTRHIIAAAHQRHELTRAKAIQALRTLDAEGSPVTFEAVAQAAAVSRSWLYAQADVRAEIERLRAAYRRAPATPVPARQRSSDASLLRSWKPQPAGSGRWPRRTASSESNSPTPLASNARRRLAIRRRHKLPGGVPVR
jgi:hypothetical protein